MELAAVVDAVGREDAVLSDGDEALVGLRIDQEWSVGVRLAPGHGTRHWHVRELLVRAGGSEAELDSQSVRDLPLGVLLAEARRLATRAARRGASRPDPELATLVSERGTRLGTDDVALAAVAHAYAELVAEGERAPAKAMAERHGGSPGTWTNRVTAARRQGFLGEGEAGAAGGGLTAKGRAVLGL